MALLTRVVNDYIEAASKDIPRFKTLLGVSGRPAVKHIKDLDTVMHSRIMQRHRKLIRTQTPEQFHNMLQKHNLSFQGQRKSYQIGEHLWLKIYKSQKDASARETSTQKQSVGYETYSALLPAGLLGLSTLALFYGYNWVQGPSQIQNISQLSRSLFNQVSFFIDRDHRHVPKQNPWSKRILALYFSASWCPPCRQFTPIFRDSYQSIDKTNLSVIFVSWDRNAEDFKNYFKQMPWIAVPYRHNLRSHFAELHNSTIPSVIIVDTVTGDILSRQGRSLIEGNPQGWLHDILQHRKR